MSAAPQSPRQALVATWGAQIVGTIVIAVVVYYYFRYAGSPFAGNEEWARWAQNAILLAALPAMMYLRKYKPWLDADAKALRLHGRPDPAVRTGLLRSLAVGGALCELPMAMGVVHLLLGGQPRWFVGAALITIALRLSYRPFTGKP
jgi:hypothetical protein